jgi:hypothetical protein
MSSPTSLVAISLLSVLAPLASCAIAAKLHRSGPLIMGTVLTWSFLFFAWDKFVSREFGFFPEACGTISTLFLFGSFVGMIFGGAYLLALPPHMIDAEQQTSS